jgi:NADH dehydrogenase FAD-containing subunit
MGQVIIVGGGYVGCELARALDGAAEVTLIEPREAFTHAPMMIRAVAVPGLTDQALIPYDNLLDHGQVLRARVREVTSEAVTLEDGRTLTADAIVVATGASYAAPFKATGDSVAPLRAASAEARELVKAADRIAIVGAGAVGTELAGEIKAAMASKSVTLISETHSLFPTYPKRLGRELLRKLDLLGVEVIRGQRAVDMTETTRPFAGGVTLADGRRIEADVTFPTIGARPETGLLTGLPGVEIGPDGRLRNDRWMRPSEYGTLFAAGDMANNGDPMTIVGASRQVPWLARTIRAVLAGRPVERVAPYMPWRRAPILVPLGPHLGNSFLQFAVVGNGLTRTIKGRDLFLPKYRKLFRT